MGGYPDSSEPIPTMPLAFKSSCDQWPGLSKRGKDPVGPVSQLPAVQDRQSPLYMHVAHVESQVADNRESVEGTAAEWSDTDRATGDWSPAQGSRG